MIRIEQLNLVFFGHFTNKQFDFGKKSDAATPDFHIVYGTNEAGKTTFMESYLRLLYGFLPRNEPYAFRHGRANLQVSALLQLDGEMRTFQRKATSKNSLVDEHGNVLPEASLQAHLGGLAMDDYRKLLCIDDDSIDKGGEEIVNSRGDIGTLLFSAAAGISDLWQVLESVRSEAEAIYKVRASRSRLAVLKKQHKDVTAKIKLLDIPAGKLGQYTKALKRAESAETKALDEQRSLMVEVRQLERILNALPMLERLDNSEQAVGNLTHYPEHLDITSQQIIELQKEQHQANAERERLQLRQATLSKELEQLPSEPAYVGLEAVIEGMSELHSRYRHAELELDAQQDSLASVTARMTSLVRERLHQDLDPASLVVEASVIKSLNESLARRNDAARLVGDEQLNLKQLNISIEGEQTRLAELERVKPEGAGLGEILEQYNAQALAAEYKAATQVIRDADQQVEEALDTLSIKGRRFSELPQCLFMVEEVETQVERWQTLNTTLATATERHQREQQELNTLTLESTQLESVDGLASDQSTQVLKDVRDAAWNTHKVSLTLETAQAFEPTLHDVDQVMEGRLAHASDLARLRDVHRQIPRIQGQIDSLAESIRAHEQELQDIEQSLAQLMQTAGIDATLPPKAVLSWVRSYHEAESRVRSAERARNTNQPVLDRAQKLKGALSGYIKREQATLAELILTASSMRDVYKHHDDSLQVTQKALADLHNKHAIAKSQLEALQVNHDKATKEWEDLVASSFPVAFDSQKLALSLDALSDLREFNIEREALLQGCNQMQRDKIQFTEKLEQIIRDNDLELGETPDSNLNQLKELAARAKKQLEEKTELQKKIDKAFADGVEAEKRMESVKAQSEVLAAIFHESVPTGDLAELFEAVQKTQHAQMLRKKYDEDISTLRQTLGVATEENARAMLAELDIPSVQEKQVEKESELALVNERSKEATEKRTRCEAQLSALTGDGEVAQLVEQRTTLELQMSEAALEYIKLSLGHRLAEQAINRYRDNHRSGMMEATERAFSELTEGKYSTLQTQSNGKDETLLALDRDGTAKRADEMSKGTRFQLYLALRAAAYDQLAEQGTCLPFICDDIFETFDEARTRAACRVMERIGQRGQAIYLTHHQHVVDLAREVCGDRVQVHQL
ncbi:MAG: AAA family ATPase [Granulosicoccus sp.]